MKIDRALATLGESPGSGNRRGVDPVEVPGRVLAALREHRPLTVLRAPRGYGKSTAIRAYVDGLDEVPVVSVTLTEQSQTPEGFWAELWSGLRAGDGDATVATLPHSDREHRLLVSGLLSELTSPLVLVIDDFHEAGRHEGAGTIDTDLVEIGRQNDHIELVLATRTRRLIETTGLLSVDGLVIEPDDLCLAAPAVQRLAHRMGVAIDAHESQQIAIDTLGWPALIRAGLARSAWGRKGFDNRLVDQYILQTLTDLQLPGLIEFSVRVAVPQEFTLQTAELLHDGQRVDCTALLRQLSASGLLHEVVEGTERCYFFSPVVRSALLRIGNELDADLVKHVHAALLQVARESNSPLQALTHAVEAGEFDIAADLLARGWGTLIASAPAQLTQLAGKFPQQYLVDHPRVQIAANELRFAPAAKVSERTAQVGAAFAGDIAERIRRGLSTSDDTSLALMHWAVTSLMLGNLDGAVYAFNRARNVGLSGGGSSAAIQMAEIGLAMCHAFAGEPELALSWLQDRPEVDQVRNGPEGDIASLAAQIAHTFSLADQGHPEALDAAAEMCQPAERDDVWAAAVVARGHAAVLSSDPERHTHAINEVRAAMRIVARGSLVELALASTLVELLLVTEAVDVALQVSQRFDSGPIAWAAQAKAALASRDYEQALTAASRCLNHPRRSWRSALEAQVIAAAAHHSLGNELAAREAFLRAVRVSQSTGQRRPFLFMPRFVFESLAALEPVAAGYWPLEESVPVPAGTSDRPMLTTKELEILRALERHPGPTGIGDELCLSANTVKTHLRAIYRKLNVRNRAEALAVAGGLGRG